MSDATTDDIPDGGGAVTATERRDRLAVLFALGFSAGISAVIALSVIQTPGSLTDMLRLDRQGERPYPPPQVSISLRNAFPGPLQSAEPSAESAQSNSTFLLPWRRDDATLSAQPDTALDRPAAPPSDPAIPTGDTVAALEDTFETLNYGLDDIRARVSAVPRVAASAVPVDLDTIEIVERRKALFFRMVLPLVLMANEQIEADRARIRRLRNQQLDGVALSDADSAWLARQWESYGVEPDAWEVLLRRVDIIPPSLAMAQAAIESGWGTSRFARHGNALFGQWVWGDDADGIIPEDRVDGATHKIRAFDTPLDAVVAYIKNLNTHRAYRSFRTIRANLRRQGAGINGMTLADGLESYSEKGREYIKLVRGIIADNQLRPFDRARLRDAGA